MMRERTTMADETLRRRIRVARKVYRYRARSPFWPGEEDSEGSGVSEGDDKEGTVKVDDGKPEIFETTVLMREIVGVDDDWRCDEEDIIG
jgi:hypothetical protein